VERHILIYCKLLTTSTDSIPPKRIAKKYSIYSS
jgi:hypothetical protein